MPSASDVRAVLSPRVWRATIALTRAALVRRRARLALLATLAACSAPSAATPTATPSTTSPLASAPEWLVRTEAKGTWVVPEHLGTVHAWVDARVANVRYDKRVFVEVYQPFGDTAIRTLHVTEHRGALGDFERWGTDTIELFPAHGPSGRVASGPSLFRFRVQHDRGRGDEMVVTPWEVLFGEGVATPPENDPWDEVLVPTVRTLEGDGLDPEIHFAPFEDPGAPILTRIRRLTERALAGERPTLRIAVMNLNDRELEDAIVEAHRAGVAVRVVHDGRKHRPAYDWYRGDDRLLDAGVPLLGVRRPGRGAMHDKIVLYDGAELSTGSMNLETGARFENHENVLFTREGSLVEAYAARWVAIAGGVLRTRAPRDSRHDDARVSVSFAPDEAPHRVVGRLLDEAEARVVLMMFTAKDVTYEENGRPTSLLTKLKEAVARGVEVTAILDHGVHEASEHYGVITEDDPTDEALEAAGVHVVLVDNPYGRYAAMHHKVVVIDDAIAVTGAFNWYHDAAYLNDEDQLVWRDVRVARAYLGEAVDLLRRYDPTFDTTEWPSVDVTLEVHHDGTRWGEGLVVVGDLPELGAWSPDAGVVLDGSAFPLWRARVSLPIGVRFEAKALVRGDTTTWERGADHALRVPSEPGTLRWDFVR
ncbi:MAG: hypothetical protein H6720_15115 [Sandaracinus sp.]|nr:hypothetical protein [Sandaracinus sp.]